MDENLIIEVAIADDHQVVVDGLSLLLGLHPTIEVIQTATHSDQLLSQFENKRPDVLILDIVMPDINGIEMTKLLKEKYPEVKVIIFSGNTPEEMMVQAVEAGANGALPKNAPQEDLIQAIESVYQGKDYFGDSVSQALVQKFLHNKNNESPISLLSEREIEVIKLFAQSKSYKEIASILFISPNTVESHKVNILKKLNLKTIVDIAKFALKNGLVED